MIIKRLIPRIILFAILEIIGYLLYKHLDLDEVWRYTFVFIYGGLAMLLYMFLTE